jgi:hypothetical protein
MTFSEWADKLELIAGEYPEIEEAIATSPWRCSGACGRLMYGLERDKKLGWNYPSPDNQPIGSFISKEYPRVCHICWELFHVVYDCDTSYWRNIQTSSKANVEKQKPGGAYL